MFRFNNHHQGAYCCALRYQPSSGSVLLYFALSSIIRERSIVLCVSNHHQGAYYCALR